MIGHRKVERYWPGKAPEWAKLANEEGDIGVACAVTSEKAFSRREGLDFVREFDRRLRRLAESRIDNRDEIGVDHRHIRQAEILSTEEEISRNEGLEAAAEEDEEALEERRRRIREKLLQRQQEETALLEEEEEEEEESEYETDSDDEDMGISMVKPVYVPKSGRDTIAERERMEAEDLAFEVAEKRNLEHRKAETRQIVVEMIREDEGIQMNRQLEANIADVDTDDEVNEAEEYEAWKGREITRIKREREESEALTEKIENKKARIMTEEERKNTKPARTPKQKWKKYYHKGVFFQSAADDPAATVGTDNISDDDPAATVGTDNICQRDFSAATGDKMDKTILSKVMQVKHFGRRGRTKWTHLLNEDTTDWSNPWTYNYLLWAKYNAKWQL